MYPSAYEDNNIFISDNNNNNNNNNMLYSYNPRYQCNSPAHGDEPTPVLQRLDSRVSRVWLECVWRVSSKPFLEKQTRLKSVVDKPF